MVVKEDKGAVHALRVLAADQSSTVDFASIPVLMKLNRLYSSWCCEAG